MKTALFIDGANLHATSKELGFEINFKSLRKYFSEGLVRAYYYTAINEVEGPDSHVAIRPLVDWLDYNGYSMVTKPSKKFVNHFGITKVKGNMDIELAVQAMELAGSIDHAVIFSGDGDFKALVLGLQRRGVLVTVVSSITTVPPQCADELRRVSDIFIDLNDIRDQLSEPRASRYG